MAEAGAGFIVEGYTNPCAGPVLYGNRYRGFTATRDGWLLEIWVCACRPACPIRPLAPGQV